MEKYPFGHTYKRTLYYISFEGCDITDMPNTTSQKEKEYNNMTAARIPGVIWIIVAFTISIFLLTHDNWPIIQYIIFTILILGFTLLFWHSNLFLPKRYWLYFLLQSLIVYTSAFIMQDIPTVSIALFPLLIGQVIGTTGRKKVYLYIIISMLFALNTIVLVSSNFLEAYLLISIPAMIVCIAYAAIFFKQVNSRIRTQYILEELEFAHQQVERLTLQNERQRIARDLHDTLAQGLAGLKMQLEATNAHLNKENYHRAHDIVKQSMERVSETLAEARLAIDNLRLHSKEEYDFQQSILDEVQNFTIATGLDCKLNYKIAQQLPNIVCEHTLRIIKECLSNTARHAKAKKVWLTLAVKDNQLFILAIDDGVGFSMEEKIKQVGHYGLLGIQERVRILGGELSIDSKPQEGTIIKIYIPLKEGE